MSTSHSKAISAHTMESVGTSDLEIVCGDLREHKFMVHKAIVGRHSEFIKKLIKTPFKMHIYEIGPASLTLNQSLIHVFDVEDNFTHATVHRMIQFMYTGDYGDPGDGRGALCAVEASQSGKCEVRENASVSRAQHHTERLTQALAGSASPAKKPVSAKDSLVSHINVNVIADFYEIPNLIALSKKKIKELLQNSEDKSWVASLPYAVREATVMGADDLLDILAAATAENLSAIGDFTELWDKDDMAKVLMMVLKHCGKVIQTLEERCECKKRQHPGEEESGDHRDSGASNKRLRE